MDSKTTVGTYHVREAFEHRVMHEYAGFNETVRVEAGDYPIERSMYYGQPQYHVRLHGTLTHSSFVNRVGACQSVRNNPTGGERTEHMHLYDYQVAAAANEGRATLAEGYGVKPHMRTEHVWDDAFSTYLPALGVMHFLTERLSA